MHLKLSNYSWLLAPQSALSNSKMRRKIFRGDEDSFQKYQAERFLFGLEGIINLRKKPPISKSLKKQITRGLAAGIPIELKLNKFNSKRITQFLESVKAKRKTNLVNLYPTSIVPDKRAFVFQNRDGKICGGIIISLKGEKRWYTEQIVRDKNAPNGAMETLFFHIFSKLRLEKQASLSLGEVPFIYSDKANYKGIIFQWVGKRLLGNDYNFDGLYKFKNKFSPHWRPVYLYGVPRIPLSSLVEIFIRSNLYLIVVKNILTGNLS